MFIPVFVLGLILWLWLAWFALRWVKLGHRKKVWRWFLVLTLLICTADHIAGIVYAHAWVAMAKGKHNLALKSDSLALQRVVGDKRYYISQEPIDLQLESYFGLVEWGYSKLQVIAPSVLDTDDLSHYVYELVLTSNAEDTDCKLFFSLPKNIKEIKPRDLSPMSSFRNQDDLLKLAATNIKEGNKARCIAVRPIPHVTARYLNKYVFIAPNPPTYPIGPFAYNYTKIIDLSTNEVVCENRGITLWGGWVFRYFFVDTEGSGKPPIYILRQPGICKIDVATEHHLDD